MFQVACRVQRSSNHVNITEPDPNPDEEKEHF